MQEKGDSILCGWNINKRLQAKEIEFKAYY